jgi:hypothetical protein
MKEKTEHVCPRDGGQVSLGVTGLAHPFCICIDTILDLNVDVTSIGAI